MCAITYVPVMYNAEAVDHAHRVVGHQSSTRSDSKTCSPPDRNSVVLSPLVPPFRFPLKCQGWGGGQLYKLMQKGDSLFLSISPSGL